MPTKTWTVSADKWDRLKNAVNGMCPCPIDPETNEREFTEAEWTFEYFRRMAVRTVLAYEREKNGDSATPDDSIIT